LTGSVPNGVKPDIYKTWIQRAKALGVKCILDADGELLRYGLEAGPYLVKPNIHELERLLNRKLNTVVDIVQTAKSLIARGTEMVVVSCGETGSVFVKKGHVSVAEGIKVDVKSTVGAGDAMVAALSYAIHEDDDFDTTMRLAAACGTAAVMSYDTQASMTDIKEILSKVAIKSL
jgi:1-phosphofructokinase